MEEKLAAVGRFSSAIAHEIRNPVAMISSALSTGPIPAEAVERIFEPFFTTRAAGTGLGLAIARNIARGHGGDLVLAHNQPGAIRFSMTLPAYTEKPESS